MTADNEINALFEKYTIAQIESNLAKTRHDIEKKKEDLRIMVGERYRDLIEAADTIAEMQCSAEAICSNIQKMQGLCESLQQRGLIGFKTKSEMSQSQLEIKRLSENSLCYSVAVQVKLFVDVPEILWSLTEKKELLEAVQLLLLAQHSHTALQLSPNAHEVMEYFPVISQQWSNIAHFKFTIAEGCSNLIQNEIFDFSALLDSVTALMFVENYGMILALSNYLDLRKMSLDDSLATKPCIMAKDQLVNFVILLISSLSFANRLFAGTESACSLETRVCEVSGLKDNGSMTQMPIFLLDEATSALNFLPKSVINFRPKLTSSYKTLDITCVQKEVAQWLAALVVEAIKSIHQLLGYVVTIKGLAMIRNSIWDAQRLKKNRELWKDVEAVLLLEPRGCPWEFCMRDPVVNRAKTLITKELSKTKVNFITMATDLIKEIKNNPRTSHEEGIITDFIWSESSSDLPIQTGWVSSMSKNLSFEKTGLLYKSRGYTKRIQAICKTLSAKLEQLCSDLFHYAPSPQQADGIMTLVGCCKDDLEVSSVWDDYKALLIHLQSETVQIFKKVLGELNDSVQEHCSHECSDPLYAEDQIKAPESILIIAISRLCHALTVACPHLKVCAGASLLAEQDSARRVTSGVELDTESWLELKNSCITLSSNLTIQFLSLVTESAASFLTKDYIELIKRSDPEDILQLFSEHMARGPNMEFILAPDLQRLPTLAWRSKDLPSFWLYVVVKESHWQSWQSVTIKEEQGKSIESVISFPSFPSPQLSEALCKVCSTANAHCAHTLTRMSQSHLSAHLLSRLTDVYKSLETSLEMVPQKVALQLIFDLKFIRDLFITKDNKDLCLEVQRLIQRIELRVDPFDLNLFNPYITPAVKAAAIRSRALLGIVLPKDKSQLAKGVALTNTSASNSMLVVPSVEIPRFSNVPMPSSRSRISVLDPDINLLLLKGPIKQTFDSHDGLKLSQSSALDATSSASRTAASLISSWFSGSTSS